MRLTCPHCQSLCRLKEDRLNSRAKRGRCPNCGNLFPIPSSPDKQLPKPSDKTSWQNFKEYFQERTQPIGKVSTLLLFTGVCLALSLAIFLTRSPLPSAKEKRPSNTSQTQPRTKTKNTPQLSQKARNKTISLIKHHALVTDANININQQQFELALLVSAKTPASYSERLGRQFAHYVKSELTASDRTKSTFRISVYYPDGTRVEVTTNDNNMDEEIISAPSR